MEMIGMQQTTAWLFKPGELDTLLGEMNVGTPTELSPLSQRPHRNKILLTPEMEAQRSNPRLLQAIRLLAGPQAAVSAVKGGGTIIRETFSVAGRREADHAEWVVLMDDDRASAILDFPDTDSLVAWFDDTFAVQTEVEIRGLLSADMTIDEWTVAAHTIDSFRRLHMESMLACRPLREAQMPAADYVAALNVALQSGDIRWLMPAFFSVTPGMADHQPQIGSDTLQSAERNGLVKLIRGADGQGGISFTTDGMSIGYEFATSWTYGVGWEARSLSNGSAKRWPACFLAPTSLGNHLIVVNRNGSAPRVTHRILTNEALVQTLKTWMEAMLPGAAERTAAAAAQQPASQPTATPAPQPTATPAPQPTAMPAQQPTAMPAPQPVPQPTATPAPQPVQQPTAMPTAQPVAQPVAMPTPQPIQQPAAAPTLQPLQQPTATAPQPAPQPTAAPTPQPAPQPTPQPATAPKFCSKCGNRLMENARFCGKCGNPIH